MDADANIGIYAQFLSGCVEASGVVHAFEPSPENFEHLHLIFKYLHHEPVDFPISDPELGDLEGPLASANIALPWLIFF